MVTWTNLKFELVATHTLTISCCDIKYECCIDVVGKTDPRGTNFIEFEGTFNFHFEKIHYFND